VIINRRTLLASIGLALPAAAAQAATGTTPGTSSHKHKTHGSTHTTHASTGSKSHHHKNSTAAAKPAATPEG